MGLMFSTIVKGGFLDHDLHLDIERTSVGTSQHHDDPGSPDEYQIGSAHVRYNNKTVWINSDLFEMILDVYSDHINDAALDAEQAGD